MVSLIALTLYIPMLFEMKFLGTDRSMHPRGRYLDFDIGRDVPLGLFKTTLCIYTGFQKYIPTYKKQEMSNGNQNQCFTLKTKVGNN